MVQISVRNCILLVHKCRSSTKPRRRPNVHFGFLVDFFFLSTWQVIMSFLEYDSKTPLATFRRNKVLSGCIFRSCNYSAPSVLQATHMDNDSSNRHQSQKKKVKGFLVTKYFRKIRQQYRGNSTSTCVHNKHALLGLCSRFTSVSFHLFFYSKGKGQTQLEDRLPLENRESLYGGKALGEMGRIHTYYQYYLKITSTCNPYLNIYSAPYVFEISDLLFV